MSERFTDDWGRGNGGKQAWSDGFAVRFVGPDIARTLLLLYEEHRNGGIGVKPN